MKKNSRLINVFLSILILVIFVNQTLGQKKSETFEFEFEGKILNGLIEFPVAQKPNSLVIIVPGSGRTDFIKGNRYNELRNFFVSLGMVCCFWDKLGCGKSEGEFKQIEHPFFAFNQKGQKKCGHKRTQSGKVFREREQNLGRFHDSLRIQSTGQFKQPGKPIGNQEIPPNIG